MTTSTLTQTSNALDKWESIFGPNGFLADHNVEREEEIEILGLCVPSGVDHQLIGDPGVGKTWLIELLLKCLPGATLYNTLIMKEMSADEVLGPRSLKALKNDELIRLTLGFLPDANFGYLDEFWKGSPPVINALLSIMAERLLKYGGKVIDCSHIRAIILSSNELPDREDLGAARDRIGLTKHVQPVRSPEGKRRVADIQLADIEGDGLSLGDIPQLELVDIDQMGAEARAVIVPDTVREKAGSNGDGLGRHDDLAAHGVEPPGRHAEGARHPDRVRRSLHAGGRRSPGGGRADPREAGRGVQEAGHGRGPGAGRGLRLGRAGARQGLR
jgi:MoxR-like ATPase